MPYVPDSYLVPTDALVFSLPAAYGTFHTVQGSSSCSLHDRVENNYIENKYAEASDLSTSSL